LLNGKKITHKHLKDLAQKTQFVWTVGDFVDPYVAELKTGFSKNAGDHESTKLDIAGVRGFIASVEKPRDLSIMDSKERVGVDLFVNGRLRELNIVKHVPTARVAESYLYGQIHFDELDDAIDRFTSSREGIVADDPKFTKFLKTFRVTILKVVDEWDKWRIRHREEGDPDNQRLSKKERASRVLYGAISKEYDLPKSSPKKGKVAGWVDELSDDAAFNFESYADCFVSENLIRKFIKDKRLPFSKEAKTEAGQWRQRERESKGRGNISIPIRRYRNDSSYLSMDHLANLADKAKDPTKDPGLSRDAREYKPIRDAVAHTALLTDAAKVKLSTVRDNIKARVRTILSEQTARAK
jgi:hypothetical protein